MEITTRGETDISPVRAIRAVADKQMTVLPVRISGQAKPLIDSVSRCYLSPQTALWNFRRTKSLCGGVPYGRRPDSVRHGLAMAFRTPGGLILYGAMGGRRHRTAPGSSLKSSASGCEPFLANSLPPGQPTCPAWPSAASFASRCEPFSPNRLIPASRDSGSDRHYGGGRPGAGSLLRCFCVEQEAARSRCAAQQNISGLPRR